ncbi:hypothetical protein [Kitasatospora viridis]|uniref:Uncharacterized protein n=1 Tax=Kitasatospora viridis TaxID=281105 RepID=A0A561TWI8_9ACTN|nr:hypothetical protein [Kitasatospora viridis]TWF91485.1 hypothetical protein FHX73_12600 [Kitasatospora viridis]
MKIDDLTHVWLERDGAATWPQEDQLLECSCPLRAAGGCVTAGKVLPALGASLSDSRGNLGRLVAVRREFGATGHVVRTAVGLHKAGSLSLRSRSWVYQCAVDPADRVRPVKGRWISPSRAYLTALYERTGSVDGVADALRISSGLARRVMRDEEVPLLPRGTRASSDPTHTRP